MSQRYSSLTLPDEIQKNIVVPSLSRKFIWKKEIKPEDQTINVLQWNILAQALSYSEGNFVRVQSETVAYDNRKWRILEQILLHEPDLFSLEEMDIYNCFLKDELAKYGYECFFTPKPNSRCLSFQSDSNNFKGPDGTLLGYRTNLFELVEHKTETLPDDGRSQKQVFSVLELKFKPLSLPLIFVGTHFKAKKQFHASRTKQAEAIIDYLNRTYSENTTMILAGDFNGESEEGFYKVFENSRFVSTYRYLMNNSEPSYTTWKFKSREENDKEESRTIDYIFYRSKSLLPIAYLDIPSKADIGSNALPSVHYPSDHLALQTIFQIEK